MKKIKQLLKVNYWLIFICFFLPFMVDTCIRDNMEKDLKKSQNTEIAAKDTSANNNVSAEKSKDTAKGAEIKPQIQKTETAKQKTTLLKEIYKHIVSPTEESISGIGFIIYYTVGGLLFLIPAICFVLLIISLIMVYRTRPKHFLLFIFSTLTIILLSLLLFLSEMKLSDFLVGFWLIFTLSFISLIMNWMLYRVSRTVQ